MTPPITAVPQGARLVLATRNPGKLAELRAILAPLVPGLDPSSIISAATAGVPEPVEDGLTFTANAEIKARALADGTGLPAVADDSGLCVDVLGGSPGIFSARGEPAPAAEPTYRRDGSAPHGALHMRRRADRTGSGSGR